MSLTVESWIEALESGRYAQIEGALRRNDAFCCLGVACDLSGAGDWSQKHPDGSKPYRIEDDLDESELPYIVQSNIGLSTACGSFDLGSLPAELQGEVKSYFSRVLVPWSSISLLALNDQGVPFSVIAKVIRARPKGLFREVTP